MVISRACAWACGRAQVGAPHPGPGQEGRDLSPYISGAQAATGLKGRAFSQVGRCPCANGCPYGAKPHDWKTEVEDRVEGAVSCHGDLIAGDGIRTYVARHGKGPITAMGYTVREAHWRYTVWVPFRVGGGGADWDPDALLAAELYAHDEKSCQATFDACEMKNLAPMSHPNETHPAALVRKGEELHAVLRAKFDTPHRTSPNLVRAEPGAADRDAKGALLPSGMRVASDEDGNNFNEEDTWEADDASRARAE